LLDIRLDAKRIHDIRFHPIFIENCRTSPADPEQHEYIENQMTALCKELRSIIDHTSLSICGRPH
jgi:hypothetical protein